MYNIHKDMAIRIIKILDFSGNIVILEAKTNIKKNRTDNRNISRYNNKNSFHLFFI